MLRFSHPTALVLLLAAAAGSAGCSDAFSSGSRGGRGQSDDDPYGQPDLVQTLITPAPLVQGIWIPGTRAVAGLIRTGGMVCSLDLIDADARSLTPLAQDAACAGSDLHWLAVSSDGGAVYYLHPDSSTGAGDATTIRRLNLANDQTTDVGSIPGGEQSIALSPDGRQLAYGYGDPGLDGGLRLLDLATGTDSLILNAGPRLSLWSGVRFSPDGTELLFADSSRLRRLSIATGARQDVPGMLYSTPRFEWTATGIQYVAQAGGGVEALRNATTGEFLGLYGDESTLAWSDDGQHVVGATSWCHDLSCRERRTEVTIGDWTTHQAVVIARENCGNVVPGLAISPAGGAAIYGVCSGTYVWIRPT